MYVQVFIIMHRVKTCRATAPSEKFPPAGRPTAAVIAGGSLISDCCAFQRAGGIPMLVGRASPARLRPRSGHSPPAPRPRAPPADRALLARSSSAVAPRASRPPLVGSRARVRPRRVSLSVGARAARVLFCAISGESPTDPVISARTGHVFERSLITKAIRAPPARVRRSPPPRRARAPRRGRCVRPGTRSFPALRSPFPRGPPRPAIPPPPSLRPSVHPHHP